MTKPAKTTTDVWIDLNRAHRKIQSAIEYSLKKAGMPPLSWYDVLLELDRAGDEGERAFVLQDKLLLPQYGLSRLLGRIEKAGYLERKSCDEDGRGQSITITKSGKIIREKAWKIYAIAMQKAIGDKLLTNEERTLAGLLKQLK